MNPQLLDHGYGGIIKLSAMHDLCILPPLDNGNVHFIFSGASCLKLCGVIISLRQEQLNFICKERDILKMWNTKFPTLSDVYRKFENVSWWRTKKN